MISLLCVALAFALHGVDGAGTLAEFQTLDAFVPAPGLDTTRALLSAIATSMITVVSLVYSLSLVVFTLAASAIAPRLLERFISGRTGQVTAGLFTGTFFYSLVLLIGMDEGAVPRVSLFGAVGLVTFAIGMLILFVREVAGQITVDAEVGRITRAIGREIDALAQGRREQAGKESDDEVIEPGDDVVEVEAPRAGYVASLDVERIVSAASQADTTVKLEVSPGDFVLMGMPVASLSCHDDPQMVVRAIKSAIVISDVRTPEGDPVFSIHLLVEIALRALSPGTNDAYTAIACIDHLSAAFARLLHEGLPASVRRDKDGNPRVAVSGLKFATLFGTAFHPVRRGARGNVIVTLALIRALGRLIAISKEDHKDLIARHLDLVLEDAHASISNNEDLAEVLSCAGQARRSEFAHS